MRFEGQVYFDLESRDTWHLYRFLAACSREGADLALAWVPFLDDEEPGRLHPLAAYAAVRDIEPEHHGEFLQAMLSVRHGSGTALDEGAVLAAAIAAGVDSAAIGAAADHEQSVRLATEEARQLGVTTTPTLYRHGPVMHVRLNPAALEGDVLARLRLIDAVLDDDGTWSLQKP
jgi:hypothetical protein